MSRIPWPLLDRTARTFALSLRILPGPVREPMALAYLLARLSDTEADGAKSPAEQMLLECRGELLGLLRESPDRAVIEAVWTTIREGQAFDQARFPPGAPPLDPSELEKYTFLVAGCVGEFWTRLCQEKIPGWASLDVERMVRLGIEFGCGLQLVNILRDRAEDAERGRVYV
ncbi:MAG: squalene/phytoene synthase family protein, partial [Terrimicrobiaceae bacterium]|nr:squalene/phytoene synthase family protein [Terrimicrobiaceae bacterium]